MSNTVLVKKAQLLCASLSQQTVHPKEGLLSPVQMCVFVSCVRQSKCRGLLLILLGVQGVKDCAGQRMTSPSGVLSVEHGVIWPLDSSTTSMKAGVNSGDV